MAQLPATLDMTPTVQVAIAELFASLGGCAAAQALPPTSPTLQFQPIALVLEEYPPLLPPVQQKQLPAPILGGHQILVPLAAYPNFIEGAIPSQDQRLLGYFLRLAQSRFSGAVRQDVHEFLTFYKERLQSLRLLESRNISFTTYQLDGPASSGGTLIQPLGQLSHHW